MFGVYMKIFLLLGLFCFTLLSQGCFSDPSDYVNMNQQIDAILLPEDSISENSTFTCDDGVDNDSDGLIDCDDPECDTTMTFCIADPLKENTLQFCTDGIDNDADALYDCEDPDCFVVEECLTDTIPPELIYEENTFLKCTNGEDDDDDELVDCDEETCQDFKYCSEDNRILNTGFKSEILQNVVIHEIPGEIEVEDFVPFSICDSMGWPYYESTPWRADWYDQLNAKRDYIVEEIPDFDLESFDLVNGIEEYDFFNLAMYDGNSPVPVPVIETSLNPIYPDGDSDVWKNGVEFRKGACGVDCVSLDHIDAGEMYSYAIDFKEVGWYTVNVKATSKAQQRVYKDWYVKLQVITFHDREKLVIDPGNLSDPDDSLTVRSYFRFTDSWDDFQYMDITHSDSLALLKIDRVDTLIVRLKNQGVPVSIDKIRIEKVSE